MSAPPFELFPVFATPLILLPVPDAEGLNVALRQAILQREKSQPSTDHSNLGGWQSSWDMDRWGGAPAIKLLAICRNLANRVTIDGTGKPELAVARQHVGQRQPQRPSQQPAPPPGCVLVRRVLRRRWRHRER